VDSSIATITVGFVIAWLGVIMLYLSFRTDPTELAKMHLGFLSKPFSKANESKKKIKILIIIGITVTAILYAASWMGLIAW
jgi:multisubunit Na+/H+ antiporter MnhB subunit